MDISRDIVATSLEALIQRATSPTNPGTDTAAIDAFCGMVNKEPNCANIATKLITMRIQSPQEWEALQALNVLEACMKKCGSPFHTEIGKFRFLNEMIKLVSPKYLGSQTPKPVRERVLHLMYSWTVEHPRETKIKEAYQMLRKQGVVTDDPPIDATVPGMSQSSTSGSGRSSVFEDEKKQRLLKKLLQSKSPDDVQAANRLIKTMVKEDERRTEIMSRRATELEAAHNNARLLSEMLDCYRPGVSSHEDLDLIKELHQSCERFSIQISRDLKPEESLFGEVMETIEELKQVFMKYQHVVVQGRPVEAAPSTSPRDTGASPSLLDLSTPSEGSLAPSVSVVTDQLTDLGLDIIPPVGNPSDLGALGDIFAIPSKGISTAVISSTSSVLQPVALNPPSASVIAESGSSKPTEEKSGAVRALEDLDVLGETLLKQSLPSTVRAGSQFNKAPTKVPMNLLGRTLSGPLDNGLVAVTEKQTHAIGDSVDMLPAPSGLDLDFLLRDSSHASITLSDKKNPVPTADDLLNGDDAMVDLSDDGIVTAAAAVAMVPKSKPSEEEIKSALPQQTISSTNGASTESVDPEMVQKTVNSSKVISSVKTASNIVDVKPLNDISVSLNSIKPGSVPPLTALDERNGISVVLHLAKDTPRSDVSVYVVSTISKNSSPLTNYVFQAVVPKTCKLKLMPASSSELPAHNPFLPPSAITQVMLLANPSKVQVNLKFMISYTMDDDTVTEMGEVESLPILD